MAKKNKPAKPVIISPLAKEDIANILFWLSENWNQEIIDKFLQKLEIFYHIISINPRVFSYYNKRKNVRKFALTNKTLFIIETEEK